MESGVGMHQRDLFEVDNADAGASDRDAAVRFAMRSGRVGPIRFGATEASYAITRDVLADLVTPPPGAAEDPS